MTHSPYALIGPTASGKESTAVPVAEAVGAEILSLDSMKLYRGMEIGTAKAPPEARDRVPHHLLDLADPDERFSTRRWLDAAEAALDDIAERRRTALFVGGTALYLKALLFGLFEGPAADLDVRRRLKAGEPEELHRRLAVVDPATAAKVHPNDVRRVIRALEVFEITGTPVSDLRREWEAACPRRAVRLAGIRRDRADLYRRIDVRIDRMIAAGLPGEVRELLARPAGLGPVARQALGYKEIADWIEGRVPDLEEALVILKRRTRLFARRQITWFKHFDIHWIDVGPEETPAETAPRVVEALGL